MAIRPNTDAKRAAPRSEAPKAELEQYGVWVKAEPQDIVEEASLASGDFDFDLPSETPSVQEEAFLSADEEKLLGEVDAELEPAPASEAKASETAFSSLPSIDEIPGIEESFLDAAPAPKAEEIEDLGSPTIDISLEELESVNAPSPIHPGVEIDMDTVQGLGADEAHPLAPAMEDVSAEFLDIEPSTSAEDVTADFLDSGESAAPKPMAPPEEFESLDIDLHFDDTLPQREGAETGGAKSTPVPGFEAVTEFDDFLAPAAQKPAVAESFDDLAAVERDLSAVEEALPESPSAPRGQGGPSADLSTEILLKIADELSSIRGELVSLKSQLCDLSREAEAGKGAEPAPSFETEEHAGAAGGFFDEEEDETIALTGDELDNILNTADFTEELAEAPATLETAEAEPAELAEEVAAPPTPPDMSMLSESILPESGDYSEAAANASPIEEIDLGGAAAAPAAGAEEASPYEEISLMAEEGVRPMTEAPEDTSYLESELGAEESAAGGLVELGLKDVPLVEPDLSSFEAEELEVEPIAEIEEELPLVEEAEAPAEELTLNVETIAEAEPIEAKKEPDQSHIVGINLHEETLEPIPEIEEIAEVEELPEAEELTALEEDIERKTVKPAEPVAIHPDEILSTLDDRLFVEEAEVAEAENAEEAPTAVAETVVPTMEPVVPPIAMAAESAIPAAEAAAPAESDHLKSEIRSVLSYLDKLLDSLPEDKIEEFARSEHFDTYKRLFEELGLV